MSYIIEHEGPLALFKGIVPQITKGILVQGLLMMTKERYVVSKIRMSSCLLMKGQDGNLVHRPFCIHAQNQS